MLFNYPKSDISKFYEEVSEPEKDRHFQDEVLERKMSVYNPNLMESVANLGTAFGGYERMQKSASINSRSISNWNKAGDNQVDASRGSDANPDDQLNISRKNSEAYNSFMNSELENSRNGMPSSASKPRRHRDSIAKRVRNNKVIPTSFGNQISVWADAIYEKHGQGNKLMFDGFFEWASKHQPFIRGFRKYFRFQLWRRLVNEKTNQTFLSYVVQSPVLQDYVDIETGLPTGPNPRGYAMLYVDFLLVWNSDDYYVLPVRVIILKNIKITSNGDNFTIEFNHDSKKYKPLRIRLARPAVWKFWKETLERYSRRANQRPLQQQVRDEKQDRGGQVLVSPPGAIADVGDRLCGEDDREGEAEGGRKGAAEVG